MTPDSIGPEYFTQFKNKLGLPPSIEQIPMVKTCTFPSKTMNVNNSTVEGNIKAIKQLLAQAGISDPVNWDENDKNTLIDISEYVILFHGDLGTCERVQSAQLYCSIEDGPYDTLRFVIFVFGLFHLKMAAADAIWQIFLRPTAAREDQSSLMNDISILRPHETSKMTSGLIFRSMHQVIQHSGICHRLDCWHIEICRRDPSVQSLKDFAVKKLTFDELRALADHLATNYIAKCQLNELHRQPADERDQQYENALIMNQYFLLYEELTYAMNAGDIGRVEVCFLSWIFIFKAVGKHKYAHQMTKFLLDVQYIYPEGLNGPLQHASQPEGTFWSFRATDWVLELNNFYTKVIYGSSSSNRTVERIEKESILIQIFRDTHLIMDRSFLPTHLTTFHPEPDMTATFDALTNHLNAISVHCTHWGRMSEYSIPDMLDRGRDLLGEHNATQVGGEPDDGKIQPDANDVGVDLI